MRANASCTASMCSMTSEGTRAGPHCQWSLNPDAGDQSSKGATAAEGNADELTSMWRLEGVYCITRFDVQRLCPSFVSICVWKGPKNHLF